MVFTLPDKQKIKMKFTNKWFVICYFNYYNSRS